MIQQVIQNNGKETDPYWDAFERLEMKQPSWLFPIRKAGISRFAEDGIGFWRIPVIYLHAVYFMGETVQGCGPLLLLALV